MRFLDGGYGACMYGWLGGNGGEKGEVMREVMARRGDVRLVMYALNGRECMNASCKFFNGEDGMTRTSCLSGILGRNDTFCQRI